MNQNWKRLIENLKMQKILKTADIIKVFEKVDRKDFVPEEYKNLAYFDEALPTAGGQTISQPYTVAFMLELLQPKAGDKILDVGAGSGWQSALLGKIVGKKGRIYAFEINSEAYVFGKNNISKYNLNIEWYCKDALKGFFEKAPFDKIIAAAALEEKIPEEWKEQLKIGGRMVAPIKNSLCLFIKKNENEFEKHQYPGFSFVPFV